VHETDIALQLCTAGNLRTALLTADLLTRAGQLDRLLIATDTPTGSGIMPLGMLYTISHLCALGGMAPEIAIAAATGNNARVYGLNSGVLAVGRDADIALIDACAGGSKDDARAALANGDIAAVSAVITDGVPRFVGRSRNTPEGIRPVRTARSSIVETFAGGAH
jgi:enamidase